MALEQNNSLVQQMQRYEVDVDDLIESNPTKRIFIVYDAHRLCLRMLTRREVDLEAVTHQFREIDTSTFYMQKYTSRTLDNYKYSVTPFGYFQPGLLKSVLTYISKGNTTNPFKEPISAFVCISPGVLLFMKEWLFPLSDQIKQIQSQSDVEISNISEDRAKKESKILTMRGYQEEAIDKLLTEGFGRGMIEAATGSGKSLIIANFIYTLRNLKLPKPNARALIYVPNIQLVEQFYSDLISYGFHEDELCKCSGALNTKDKNIMEKTIKTAWVVIANSAWCNNHIDEIGDVDILIIDEAHRCTPKSKGFINIKEHLFNTKIRVGFTGTLPQGYNLWELEGLLGPVLYKATVVELQNEGYLTNLAIAKIRIRDKIVDDDPNFLFNIHSKWKLGEFQEDTGTLIDSGDAWVAEQDWVTNNCQRIYAPVFERLTDDPKTQQLNTLILFDRILLGHNLFGLIETFLNEKNLSNVNLLYIDGSTEVSKREQIRKNLENSNGNILLGQSSILSTGINIKNLTRIVLISGGKAQARIIQAIGRTLRLNKGKTQSELVDIEVSYRYSKRHAAERKFLYKKWYNKTKFDQELDFEI